MAIQHIVDEKGVPTHVVLSMEEWQGILSSNANIPENLKGQIEIPQAVQDEVMRRMKDVTTTSGITRQELREKLGF